MSQQKSISKFWIVSQIVNFFKLGEEGKVEKFFDKQRKDLVREIKLLDTNISTTKLNTDHEIDDLNYQLADAKEAVDNAYVSVNVEAINSNEEITQEAKRYWGNIVNAEAKVELLTSKIAEVKENTAKTIQGFEDQITERRRRLEKISKEAK